MTTNDKEQFDLVYLAGFLATWIFVTVHCLILGQRLDDSIVIGLLAGVFWPITWIAIYLPWGISLLLN